MSANGQDYDRLCFVIMPFGKKPLGKRRLIPFLPWPHSAAELSEWHSFALLNALKIRAVNDGRNNLDEAINFRLTVADRFRQSQVGTSPRSTRPGASSIWPRSGCIRVPRTFSSR